MATGPVSLCERRLPEGEGNNKSTKRPTASSIFTGGTPQRLGYNLSSLGPTRFRIRKTHGSTMARAHTPCTHLPLKNQVTLGEGAPSASHGIVASFPSSAVMFRGGLTNTGDEAAMGGDVYGQSPQRSHIFFVLRHCFIAMTTSSIQETTFYRNLV